MKPYPRVCLPRHAETKSLVQMYHESTTYMYHVIYAPSVEGPVDKIYGTLTSNKGCNASQIALLLNMLASTAYTWNPGSQSRSLHDHQGSTQASENMDKVHT